ncbi:MAG: hypothetical protein VX681_03285 [Myxococcota bacterium]|nr:hypothetical protein [Myxococcota bacterium]
MPILPIIDLLILLAWTSLAAGAALKLVNIVFSRFWTLLGFAPLDFFMITAVLLVFALTLVARTWVKANDPAVLAARRADATREAYADLRPDATAAKQPHAARTGVWQPRQLGL